MRLNVNPLLLAHGLRVEITEDPDADSPNPTYLDVVPGAGFDPAQLASRPLDELDLRFHLYLNTQRIRALYAPLAAQAPVSLAEFQFAFITKELTAIRYGTVTFARFAPVPAPYAGNMVWRYIFDQLEQRRCRYRLAGELPVFDAFLALHTTYVRTQISVEAQDRSVARFEHILARYELIRDHLRELHDLTVHNRVTPGGVSEFALAHMLVAQRGDVGTSARAAMAIYDWIVLPGDLNRAVGFRFTDVTEPVDEDTDAAPSEPRPAIEPDEAVGFYRDVLVTCWDEIVRLRNVFRRVLAATQAVEVFDGDVDLRKQQAIYLDSLTGDEGRNYLNRRFQATSLDVVILRDISFSTHPARVEYAQAVVVLLAALEQMPQVRTAQLDFSEIATVNKRFDQPVSQAAVAPEAFGGTLLAPGLVQLERFAFRASKRLVFILTDGEIADADECRDLLARLRAEHGLVFVPVEVRTDDRDADAGDAGTVASNPGASDPVLGRHEIVTGIATLPRALLRRILQELG